METVRKGGGEGVMEKYHMKLLDSVCAKICREKYGICSGYICTMKVRKPGCIGKTYRDVCMA